MRVLVVDDHEVVRRGVRSLIQSQSNYDVCGEAVDGQDAVEKARLLNPDVVVMDVSMPRLNGLEATHLIRIAQPDSEVLILSQHESSEMARQAFQAGARGYVVKSSIARDLLTALDHVSRHQPFFDPAISETGGSVHLDAKEILQRSAALELALRESEEMYRSTFELAELGVAHQSPDGRWLQVNQKLCHILGYSKDELLRMKFQDITHPEDLEVELPQLEKMRAGLADTYATDKRYIRKDGSVVWASLRVSAVRGRHREVKRFITVVEDITSRREAEQAKYRLAAIVESSQDAIISKDLNGIIASWNMGAQRIFEFLPEEAIGRSITIIIPEELQHEEKYIIQRLRQGQRIESYETIRRTKSGRRLNISLTVSPVRDAEGRIIGASKIARDITERKATNKALKEGAARLRAAFSQTYSFFVLLETDGTIIEANRAALEAAGTDDVVGRKFWEPWWSPLPEEETRLRTSVARAAAGELIREECYFSLPDGSRRFAHRTLSPVLDANGQVLMLVATGLDLTEQKELREKLEARVHQRTSELEEKNCALLAQAATVRELSGRLLRAQDEERRRIARDLHDSSGQIVVAVQMHLAPLEAKAQQSNPEFVPGIHQSLELMNELSKELRTVSYLLHPPLLDEAGLSAALQCYVEGFAQRSKIEVQLEVAPDLNRLSRDLETTIFRIVQESLTNIHRHSGGNRAGIKLFRFGDEVCLQVKDNGRGIAANTANIGPAAQIRVGVGIQGMRERVQQLGGNFEIKSDASGATVSATFPAAGLPQNLDPESLMHLL